MDKQKRWHLWLILAVMALTLYNILPTLFYYSKPLSSAVDAPRAESIAHHITERIEQLHGQAVDWIYSFSKQIAVHPQEVTIDPKYPSLVKVVFSTEKEADRFARLLPQAGALIPFAPAQLSLLTKADQESTSQPSTTVWVYRRIPLTIEAPHELFSFFLKQENDQFSAPYLSALRARTSHVATVLTAADDTALLAQAVGQSADPEATRALAQQLVDIQQTLHTQPALFKRYTDYLGQTLGKETLKALASQFAKVKKQASLAKEASPSTATKEQQTTLLTQAEQWIDSLVKTAPSLPTPPIDFAKIVAETPIPTVHNGTFMLDLQGRNPWVRALTLDYVHGRIELDLYPDLEKIRQAHIHSEASAVEQELINRLLSRSLADYARNAHEELATSQESFAIPLTSTPEAISFLSLKLAPVAQAELHTVAHVLSTLFTPTSRDLQPKLYPIRFADQYVKESAEDKAFGFVLYAPTQEEKTWPGFHKGSLYVIAKGMEGLLAQQTESPSLHEDAEKLDALLGRMGFISYPGAVFGFDKTFAKDRIFQLDDYYSPLLQASREHFEVHAQQPYALLPFTDVEQRIITENQIDDRTQEDLLKWVEAYDSALVDADPLAKYLIPKPTQNPYWTNFKINIAKYFRGDDRKILKWGLDLSGGKTVRIGLRDLNGKPVTQQADLQQAVSELYNRINTLGVAERTIRIENENIVLEFPGSQALSASDLIEASAMSFHLVNEKFSTQNPALRQAVQSFLQAVWNEAVVTNRKDPESIKEIAWNHLGGDFVEGQPRPISAAARQLLDEGLRLANPHEQLASNTFDDTWSTVALTRQEALSSWQGQTHPLVIVFNNYALEGSQLSDIRVGYDSTEGNTLSFSVKRSYDRGQPGSPRDDFYAWTSQFAEDKIAGTPKEHYSQGRGWRMAVILNGSIISQPALRAALRDSATITGRFTQREVQQLAADLKAGSLSFTPRILSEQNVSADLGAEERSKGIRASLIALVLVIVAMVAYYRFAGIVASFAVVINILIMWGVLQNLDAALTLPAIAGIVLTIGMAVDANVLVFERVREEFALTGRIASAIQAGYRKAFTAIVDSNITTILAALILIQFDSGPIKGFAVTLIVGILSSMFTALFMTRYYFAGWVQNPTHKSLSMAQFFKKTEIPFLSYTRMAFGLSALVIVLGSYLLFAERKTMLGMDFTGGYAATIEVQAQETGDYRLMATEGLLAKGASPRDLHVRQLSAPNQLKIQLGMGIEEEGQPFYKMAAEQNEGTLAYPYQSNPRLIWLVQALESGGLTLSDSELMRLSNNWTVMSGQFSDAMRDHAFTALTLALISILIYITVRFEFKYALAAVIGLAHDVWITLGLLAFFHAMGFLVQIDLQVIGALMTIIGYSLNDTIIVFDRVREEARLFPRWSYASVINHALNVTLSRTMMTSGTTLLVLLALVLLGGQTIFAFSLTMTLGVIVGTLSSLFIAAPTLLFLNQREQSEGLSERIS